MAIQIKFLESRDGPSWESIDRVESTIARNRLNNNRYNLNVGCAFISPLKTPPRPALALPFLESTCAKSCEFTHARAIKWMETIQSVITTPALIFCLEAPTTNANIKFETLVSVAPECTEKLESITEKRNSVYHGMQKKYLDSALTSLFAYYPSFLGLVCFMAISVLYCLLFRWNCTTMRLIPSR
jgi:hypothetical protein